MDTSVPSAFFDERMPDRQRSTKFFWEKLGSYEVYLSEVTVNEIKQTLNPDKREKLLDLVKYFKILSRTSEGNDLAAHQNWLKEV